MSDKFGYVKNSLLKPREDDVSGYLFFQDGEGLKAFLDGYAIIPLEEYAELTEEDFSDMLSKIGE